MLDNSAYKTFFESSEFQSKWQAYKAAFGDDLDELFGEDYGKKIGLARGLQLLLENKLSYAYYTEFRHFSVDCETETDRRIYERLVSLCYNEKEMATVRGLLD